MDDALWHIRVDDRPYGSVRLDQDPVPQDRLWLDYGQGCAFASFVPERSGVEVVILYVSEEHRLIFATRARARRR